MLTRYVRNTAVLRGWVAAPSSARHLHTVPIPRLGGVAIFLAFSVGVGLLVAASILFKLPFDLSPRTILYLLLPGTLVFFLGLYDDIYSTNPYVKFAVQSVAATLLFFGGFRVFQLPLLFSTHDLGWLGLPLTIFWVLWITNAFNLLDGLDGLAAGSALFSTLALFVVSLIANNHMVSLFTLGLAGTILGFLRFNFNPATIFLGDCGSLFLGFMLSALALVGVQKAPTLVAVGIPVVSFGLPILDTTLSVLRRFLNGQPLFAADRKHIHHKLLERGLSQRQVVIILYGVSAVFGLFSLFLLYPEGGTVGIVLFVLGVGIWVGVQHLGYPEFAELGRAAQRAIVQKQIIINNLAIRRAAEKLPGVQSFYQLYQVLQDTFETNDFDGFQLSLSSEDQKSKKEDHGLLSSIFELQASLPSSCWTWCKSMNSLKTDKEPVSRWVLTLELITPKKQRCGFFSLYRTCNDRPLLVDVNLITSEFYLALTDAVDRIIGQDRVNSASSSAR